MLDARRTFLNAGYYTPLCEAVVAASVGAMPRKGVLLDGGAGEGYYTDRVECSLTDMGKRASVYAFDIAKDAVKMMANRNKRLHLFVASAYDIPVSDGSVDVALNLFAPFCAEEYVRVLRPGGTLVMAVPDENHLFGMKEVLYPDPYRNKVSDRVPEGFSLADTVHVQFGITLRDPAHIRALFSMTPYAYRTDAAGRARLDALRELSTPIGFFVFSYRKSATKP